MPGPVSVHDIFNRLNLMVSVVIVLYLLTVENIARSEGASYGSTSTAIDPALGVNLMALDRMLRST